MYESADYIYVDRRGRRENKAAYGRREEEETSNVSFMVNCITKISSLSL